MRQKSKKVRRQGALNENFEANATNRVFIVQIVTSQKGQQRQNSFLGKKGGKNRPKKNFFFDIFFFIFLNKTE